MTFAPSNGDPAIRAGETPFLLRYAEPVGLRHDVRHEPSFDLGALLHRLLPSLLSAESLRTEILLLCNQRDPDADLLERELAGRGMPSIRLNVEDIPAHLRMTWRFDGSAAAGSLSVGERRIELSDIRRAWYHVCRFGVTPRTVRGAAERGFAEREWGAALPGFWRTYDGYWVNAPDATLAAKDKLGQLTLAAALGFAVPATLVTSDPREARTFYAAYAGRVIAKTLHAHGLPRGRHQYAVFARRLRNEDLPLLDALVHAPCILQEHIDKRVEVRATVVSDQVFAAEIHSGDIAEAHEDYHRALTEIPLSVHDLPVDVADQCRQLVKHLGLSFAGIDLIVTPDGRYVFLEANPTGSWDWLERRTGLPITQAVADLLTQPTSVSTLGV